MLGIGGDVVGGGGGGYLGQERCMIRRDGREVCDSVRKVTVQVNQRTFGCYMVVDLNSVGIALVQGPAKVVLEVPQCYRPFQLV